MEEKILEILRNKIHPMAGHSWLLGLDNSDIELSSKEITAHVMEFIEWVYENTDISSNVSNTWYVLGVDESICFMTTLELYQYWLNNIKNK